MELWMLRDGEEEEHSRAYLVRWSLCGGSSPRRRSGVWVAGLVGMVVCARLPAS
jgi:hypothetical protein